MKLEADIETEITFLTTEEGGRKTSAFSGYRPQFHYDGRDWIAVHKYIEFSEVFPGQTVIAQLIFMNPQEHIGKLHAGKEFLIREGQRTIAHGRVTKILNLSDSAKRLNLIRKEI